MELKKVIEALVFASQKPLSIKEIVAALRGAGSSSDDQDAKALAETKDAEVAGLLEELRIESEQAGRAFLLVEKASGWQFVSHPDCGPWVRQLFPESRPARLSGPALETLAIVAYRQPITRADIEAVRGVAVDGIVQSLLEKGLVRIAGRSDAPGRPLLYETTEFFLEHFGLRSLDELPNADELRRIRLPAATPPPTPETTPQQMTLEAAAPAPAADDPHPTSASATTTSQEANPPAPATERGNHEPDTTP